MLIPPSDGKIEPSGDQGASVAEVLDIDQFEVGRSILPDLEIAGLIDADGHGIGAETDGITQSGIVRDCEGPGPLFFLLYSLA